MAFLRKLADSGQSIVCTYVHDAVLLFDTVLHWFNRRIHQPSAELFEVFDKLLLLRKGGQTVYFGDLGLQSSSVISYFERNGSRRCEDDENP